MTVISLLGVVRNPANGFPARPLVPLIWLAITCSDFYSEYTGEKIKAQILRGNGAVAKSVAERARTFRETRSNSGRCRDCGGALSDPEANRCVDCNKKKKGKQQATRAADNKVKRWESNKMAAPAAAEGMLALHRICYLRDRVNRLEEAYDKLAKRFEGRLASALPPEKPERLVLENLPPLPPILDLPDKADPDWPRKPLKCLKQKDWNYEDPLADAYWLATCFYLQNVSQMEFRSHEKRWQEEGFLFAIALTEWLQRHESALQREDEAMRKAVIDLHALVKEASA